MIEKNYTVLESFGMFVFVVIMGIIGVFINGFVIYKFYNWFVFPISLFQLSFLQCCGINIFIAALKNTDGKQSFKSYSEIAVSIFSKFASNGLFLLFGWIIFLLIRA